jgi:Outer membrane protein beta-barrel domain
MVSPRKASSAPSRSRMLSSFGYLASRWLCDSVRSRMVKASVLALGLTVGAVSILPGQRREVTVLGGGTLSGASGSNIDQLQTRVGFAGGISLRLPRTPEFSLEAQLLVVQRRVTGQRAPSTQSPLQAGPLKDAADLVFVEIPVLLRIQQGFSTARPLRPFVQLGAYAALRVACNHVVTAGNGSNQAVGCNIGSGTFTAGPDTYIPAVYQDVDVGLLAGGGIEIRRFALGFRFERSFRNLVEPAGAVHTSPFDGSRVWTMMVSLEYLVRVL